jgi:hypothetical protein
MSRIRYPKTLSLLMLLFAIYWSFSSLMPNENHFKTSNPKEYSLDKALVHLKEMTKEPHFVGTANHKVVQDYIITQLQALGYTVELEKAIGINEKWRSAVKTENILVRIKGTNSGKALLLMSHYDSSPHSSRGASDNGVGVATILEALRVYKANKKQPKNDIIVFINDAEETGLNGADAFVRSHPWAKDVGLVINFEARGSGGPSYLLMETNGGNSKLLKAYTKANPKYTVGNSLMYSIYKMLPNDTDLTVFREQADIEGLNFAFIDDYFDYHTYEDSYENVDLNSMTHQATYLLPLLDYFSQNDLNNLKDTSDYVFVNLPLIDILYYPFSWVLPMWILAFVLFIFLLLVAMRKQVITTKEVMQSFKPFLSSLVLSAGITFLGWKALLLIYPNYNEISHGFTYNGRLYQLFFAFITVAIVLKMYGKFALKISKASLLVAPLFIWLLLNAFLAFRLQGGGFFIIPVLLSLGVFAILIYSRRSIAHNIFWVALLGVPSILIFAPLIKMFPVGLGLKVLFIASILIVFVLSLFSPIFTTFKSKKLLRRIFVLIAIILFFMAHFKAPFNENRKRPNSINFVYDKDLNKSFWFTYDKSLDAYTKQVLKPEDPKGDLGIVLANKHRNGIQQYAETEDRQVRPATVLKVKDTVIDNDREVTFHIIQQRKLNGLILVSNKNLNLKSLKIQGVSFDKKAGDYVMKTDEKLQNILTYFITDEDEMLDVSFSFDKNEKPDINLYEVSYDLLQDRRFKLKERTVSMMPKPFIVNDAVLVKRKLDL